MCEKALESNSTSTLTRNSDRPGGCMGWRHIVAICGFLGCLISYATRSNISVALVAMVRNSGSHVDGSTVSTACTPTPFNVSSAPSSIDLLEQSGEFDWDEKVQGIILGGFFWGYMIPQLIGARIAERYSAKMVVQIGGALGIVATLLGPVAARTNVGLFVATRVICGLGMAVLTPSFHCLIARWSHPTERSIISAIVYSGVQFGVIIALPIAGYMAGVEWDGGWPWAFYIFGRLQRISGIVWLILWTILVSDTPGQHPWISDAERSYIEDGLRMELNSSKPSVPWKHLAKSKALWSLAFAYFGHNWGFYTLLTQLPTYMKNMLGFSVQANGINSSLPYVLMMINGIFNSIIADFLIRRKIMSTGAVRKMCNTIALYGSATCLLAITFLECNTMFIYALIVLAVGMDGGVYSGFQVNQVDLSPNFAGTLQAITNTLACVPGIVSPYITGVITNGHQTHDRWSIVFYISFGVMIVFSTQFWMFGEGEVQYWNNLDGSNKEPTPITKKKQTSQGTSANEDIEYSYQNHDSDNGVKYNYKTIGT